MDATSDDSDTPPAQLALVQAGCALALGRLDGLLAGLTPQETMLFGAGLVREVVMGALAQGGFTDAAWRFEAWFCGLDRGPQETALTPCSAFALVRALLGELSLHPWAPLAEAARTIATAARFSPEHAGQAREALPGEAVARAAELVMQASANGDTPLPFADIVRLNALLREDTLFAPVEHGSRRIAVAGRAGTIEQLAPPPPLWAVDLALGQLLAARGTWTRALPCPGAITAEALRPALEPSQRALLAARSLEASALRLGQLVAAARTRAGIMREHLGHLRTSARAPQVWILLAAFAPLGLGQIGSAFGVSRRGTYAVRDALVAAGLARHESAKGKVLLVAEEPRGARFLPPAEASPLAHSTLAEFDAAMADIDRLLARGSGQS